MEEKIEPQEKTCMPAGVKNLHGDAEHGHTRRDLDRWDSKLCLSACLMFLGSMMTLISRSKQQIFIIWAQVQQSLRCLTFCTLVPTGARNLVVESHAASRDLLDHYLNGARKFKVRARRETYLRDVQRFVPARCDCRVWR